MEPTDQTDDSAPQGDQNDAADPNLTPQDSAASAEPPQSSSDAPDPGVQGDAASDTGNAVETAAGATAGSDAEAADIEDGVIIEPVVGRVVHVYRVERDHEPCAGTICAVHDARTINVGGFRRNGHPYGHTNIQLLQPGDVPSDEGIYATWMPYQIGQALEVKKRRQKYLDRLSQQQSGQGEQTSGAAS